MPDLPPDGVLLRVLYLSLDPGVLDRMDERRSNAKPLGIDEVIAGESVSEVIASDHPAYAIGDLALSSTGWRTHVASDGTGLRELDSAFAPVTTALGVLGTPGFAAYSGITLIGKPKAGETVVVDAVGSLIGQLAKMAGARAVGVTSGLEQCRYLERELGFDAAIVHHIPGFAERLARACPDGIDVYFERVGGPIWYAVLPLLNRFARVPVCSLSTQHRAAAEGGDGLMGTMREVLNKSLTLRGFTNEEFADSHYPQFLRTVSGGIAAGRIRYREHITEGLESAPKAFIDMLEGRNLGMALVRVAPSAATFP
jgi:NADPH-dependent curcumin reductase CurA